MARAVGVIVAGGSGSRFGGLVPKQFLPLAGRPLLVHALERFLGSASIFRVVLVLPREGFDDASKLMKPFLAGRRVETVPGGATRQDSVREGLLHADDAEEGDPLVAVHDGARPLVSPELVDAVVAAAAAEPEGGAIAAVPVVETLKRVSPGGLVEDTVDRERFYRAQTPQCFRLSLLSRALREAREAGFVGTDEAALVERLGAPVRVVPGSEHNLKVTSAEDLARVELYAGAEGLT